MFRELIARLGQRESRQLRGAAEQDWLARGNAALANGDMAEAERSYRAAIAADAKNPLARLNLGFALLQRDPPGAVTALQQALALRRPGDDFMHEAYYLLGRARSGAGDLAGAEADLLEALRLRPDFPPPLDALLARAHALHDESRHPEALDVLAGVLGVVPGQPQAVEGRAHVLLALRRPREALSDFDALLSTGVRTPDLLSSRAAALQACGRVEDALASAEAALAMDAQHRDALYNCASILLEMHRLAEAEATCSRLLARDPADADARWNRAIARLMAGDHEGGWADYEARWQAKAAANGERPDVDVPTWTGGEDLHGRRILVHREQGLGDVLQFVRYVPLLQERGARVVLSAPQVVHSLLQDALPGCELVAGGDAVAQPDFQCMLLSLPLAFRTTLATVPARVPYLRSQPALRQEWEQRLGPRRGLRVGVVWSGSAGFRNDARRSIPLALFRSVEVPGVQFVSLQKEVRDSDRDAMRAWSALEHHGDALRSFADTAALADLLDIVISVDTSVAHLAGGLGRPLWLLLPDRPDWRWMLERSDSPWYPTARLFRQSAPGDWAGVLARARSALVDRANAEGS